VVIANAKIYREELSDDSLVHFDPDKAKQSREAFVRLKKADVAEARRAWEAAQRADVEREAYVSAGYIQIKGEWETQKEFFDGRIADLKSRWRERLLPKIHDHVYYDFGYVLYNNEWMKPEEREARIRAANDPNAPKGAGGKTTPPATTTGGAPATGTGDADDFFGNP
jgi:hypothetical protein